MPQLNRLATQRSPYLRQHATNPVDWYPWCPEALERARQLDRPIFLSIGYAACHWCHVMEHECFENPYIAALLNEHFVSIKVDREERPDLDALYMNALHLLTREGGGWPLSVFLTPTLTPFYAGTYFPPDDRYAPHRPSFPRVLLAIAEAWKTRRGEIEELGQRVTAALQQMQVRESSPEVLSETILRQAGRTLQRWFDRVHGGFGTAPKFPHPVELSLLLRLAIRFADQQMASMVRQTLKAMACGGMNDHLGGGFSLYSVDARWFLPHFEKMLYDNALLASVYTEAALLLNDSFLADVARSTLDYILRDLRVPPGLFASSEDADSEGEEGKFYLWTEAQIRELLGPDAGEFACKVWNVTPEGNFEGKSILYRSGSDEEDAARLGLKLEEFRQRLQTVRQQLLSIRQQRIRPARDDKIITAWNAWTIEALARAGIAWDVPDYLSAACTAAELLLRYARDSQQRLLRLAVTPDDRVPDAPPLAFLEDYSALINALITLYETTGSVSYLQQATELAEAMVDRFADPHGPGLFFTATDQEPLPVRLKEHQDGATPSGQALALTALLRLSHLLQRSTWTAIVREVLQTQVPLMQEQPLGAGQFLIALDWYLGPVEQVAVIGDARAPEVQQVRKMMGRIFRPRQVLAYHDPQAGAAPTLIPWLSDKPLRDGPVVVYRCQDFRCDAPLMDLDAIQAAFHSTSIFPTTPLTSDQ
ncbi:MAG: thioredoxin domain-containing protein [Gemmataceae bacterium]|nr:thioredoxin domain-containing protein [Gemmataceae bacterium]